MVRPEAIEHVFLVEDDVQCAGLVRAFLERHHFRVSLEERGDRAVHRILTEQPDGVILALELPGLDGLELCRTLRQAYQGPVVMLSARETEVDEILALELGADDYILKPIRPRVLLARLKALFRRAGQYRMPIESEALASGRLDLGRLVIEGLNRRVFLDRKEIKLTASEFDLLWFLACNRGRVATRERIFGEVFGADYDGANRLIDRRVARLRKKLRDDAKRSQIIKSVRGEGYLMVVWA
ncbi:response regulator [Candidatus Entotheonella palauensis]|uniref:Transcriptional regulator n=1 Tax=Candidatus Entotheonella gemina TaxID=1429439 RepID=W4MHB8_9BACT|nr:response regulator [Candidatus Entotheonella palauensis]ETX09102.1 MAG: hypothetical protein ETSY2_01495 [Candidatus Entotheonella gemina]